MKMPRRKLRSCSRSCRSPLQREEWSSSPMNEPENLDSPIVVAPAASVLPAILDVLGPSSPRAIGPLDTSRDAEIARKLFVEMNREDLGILGDSDLVILSSDDEEDVVEEGKVDEEEEDDAAGSGGMSRDSQATPISSPSP